MRVHLIYPSLRKSRVSSARRNQPRSQRYPGMGLTLLAALSPPDVQVSIVDDEHEEIAYDSPVDLVGISLLTCNAKRGYEIARGYRERGIPVVLGGAHVTACPEEARAEADSVVIGEAEDTWPQLLKDFGAGVLRPAYRSANDASLAGLPFPRRDLLKKQDYITVNSVQATRGCPFNCEFCSITALFGRRTRCRPVEEVVEEIRSLAGEVFLLNDDNLAQEPDYFKELFSKLIPLKKKWVGEASWNISKDAEMLELMERSGCAGVFVGFESVVPQEGLAKIVRAENRTLLYKEAVQKLHDRRMCVIGAFIFGFDNDDESVFAKTLEFALESRIDTAQINILVPYPGTPLYARLESEGRLTDKNWDHYMTDRLCFKPKKLSPSLLLEKYAWVRRKFFTYPHLAMRVARAPFHARPQVIPVVLAVNLAFRRGTKEIPPHPQAAASGPSSRSYRSGCVGG